MCLLAFSCLKLFCLTALISFQSSLLGTMRTVRDKILCPTPSKTLMVLLFTDVTLKDYQIPVFTRTSHKYFGVQDLRIVFLSEISICLTVKAAAFTSDCSAVVWKSQHVCVCVSAVSGKHHLNLLCAHSSSGCGCRSLSAVTRGRMLTVYALHYACS